MHRNSAKISLDGQPVSWLGANYWSRVGGPRMWRDYDAAVIDEELAVLADHGLNVSRSFFYWPDFMPVPDKVDEALVERFAEFLDQHLRAGLSTIPTFIVGHMSGQNWDPAWRGGRDLYGDVWLVARQAWFIGEMVRRFAGHPAVAGWLISNEMPIYGGSAPTEIVSSWAQLVIDAVRAAGAVQPVSLGDGAWGIEVTGVDNGFSLRQISRMVDFLGPHVYPMEDDIVRQNYAAAFACELAGSFGRPVVLEEFGASTDFVSSENVAHYYRQVLHNSLLAGATGWIAWNNTDYDDLVGQDPYRHHPFEMHFGITTSTGEPKPPLAEMAAFARMLARIDVVHTRRPDVDTALVVPSYLEIGYPWTVDADRSFVHANLLQAYVAARTADLAVGLTRERDGIDGHARLYLLPSLKQLTGPGWLRLEELARGGATVYVSYSSGNNATQRGPWWVGMNRLFGIEHQLYYGLAEAIVDDGLEMRFGIAFGGIEAGRILRFVVAGNAHVRTYLPVRQTEAEVLATDAHGRPALLRRTVGAGQVVLGTYPVEAMAALASRVNPEDTSALYAALAEAAGVRRPVTVADPRVGADVLEHADGRRFAIFVSQADEPVTVAPETPGVRLTPLDGGDTVSEVTLGKYGVAVLELSEVVSSPTAR